MNNTQIDAKIKQFIGVIGKDSIRNLPYSWEKINENALIVFEQENSKEGVGRAINESSGSNTVSFEIANSFISDSFIKAVQGANKKGMWMVFYLNCDLHPEVIRILKQIAEENEFAIEDQDARKIINVKLNPKMRIICVASRQTIEEKITYPYFYNLFGPVLSL